MFDEEDDSVPEERPRSGSRVALDEYFAKKAEKHSLAQPVPSDMSLDTAIGTHIAKRTRSKSNYACVTKSGCGKKLMLSCVLPKTDWPELCKIPDANSQASIPLLDISKKANVRRNKDTQKSSLRKNTPNRNSANGKSPAPFPVKGRISPTSRYYKCCKSSPSKIYAAPKCCNLYPYRDKAAYYRHPRITKGSESPTRTTPNQQKRRADLIGVKKSSTSPSTLPTRPLSRPKTRNDRLSSPSEPDSRYTAFTTMTDDEEEEEDADYLDVCAMAYSESSADYYDILVQNYAERARRYGAEIAVGLHVIEKALKTENVKKQLSPMMQRNVIMNKAQRLRAETVARSVEVHEKKHPSSRYACPSDSTATSISCPRVSPDIKVRKKPSPMKIGDIIMNKAQELRAATVQIRTADREQRTNDPGTTDVKKYVPHPPNSPRPSKTTFGDIKMNKAQTFRARALAAHVASTRRDLDNAPRSHLKLQDVTRLNTNVTTSSASKIDDIKMNKAQSIRAQAVRMANSKRKPKHSACLKIPDDVGTGHSPTESSQLSACIPDTIKMIKAQSVRTEGVPFASSEPSTSPGNYLTEPDESGTDTTVTAGDMPSTSCPRLIKPY